MKPSKYLIETIMKIHSEVDQPGSSISGVCRKYFISRSTFDNWKEKYKGLTLEEAKR